MDNVKDASNAIVYQENIPPKTVKFRHLEDGILDSVLADYVTDTELTTAFSDYTDGQLASILNAYTLNDPGVGEYQFLLNTTVVSLVIAYTPNPSDTVDIDLFGTAVHRIYMPAGDITLNLVSTTAGNDEAELRYSFEIIQDPVGGRLVTWFSGITWEGGSPPVLTITGDHTDYIELRTTTGTNTHNGFLLASDIG